MADIVLNVLVFLATAVLVLSFPRKDGQWYPERIKKAFRFFTCQSNAFCAAACLADMDAEVYRYSGGYGHNADSIFVSGSGNREGMGRNSSDAYGFGFFKHLLTPLAALFSFCLLEKREMSFVQALAGMLPVILYGILYIYKTQFAPEGKRWEDFYGFNRNGRMLISALGMTAGTFSVCMMLMAFQNL